MASRPCNDGLFCPNCGAKNNDDAVFCKSCGAKLNDSTPATQAGAAAAPAVEGGMKGMIMGAFRNAIALVKNPAGYMTQNKDATTTTRSLVINYVAILAAIAFVGTLIGDLVTFSASGKYVYAIPGAILAYILEIIGFFIVGVVIWKLAPRFATMTTQDKSMRLAAYSYTPVFLASIFYAIPGVGSILAFIALLYGLYILYKGMPIVLGTPSNRVMAYFITTLIIVIVISVVLSLIAGFATGAVTH
jgi:hypothetical protein